jgi:predicted ATPase
LFLNERGERQAAYEIAGEMLDVAEQRADSSLLIPAHRAMSMTRLYLGRFVASREHAERVLTLFDPAQHRSLVSRYAFDQRTVALGYLASALFTLGYPEQARSRIAAAVEEARSLAHPPSLAQALQFMCRLQCMSRDVAGLQDEADRMIAIAIERDLPDFKAFGRFWRGIVWLEAGRTEDGLLEVGEGRTSTGRVGNNLILAENLVSPARRQPISELVKAQLGEGPGSLWSAAEWHRMAGERLLSSADPDQREAEAHFRRALEVARDQQAKMWELRATTSLARLWARHGERQKVRDLLVPIYDWFTEGFDTPDLKDAKALLDALR